MKFFRNIYDEIWNEPVEFPFVRRFFAAVVDISLICLADLIVLWAIFDYVGQSVYGFYFAIVYFTISNHKLTKGQSLGKLVFKIRVHDKSGAYLNLVKSFARSALISFTYYGPSLLMYLWPIYPEAARERYALAILFLLISFGVIFFAVFDFAHRGLHDLLIGSQVNFRKGFEPITKKMNFSLVIVYIVVSLLIVTYHYLLK